MISTVVVGLLTDLDDIVIAGHDEFDDISNFNYEVCRCEIEALSSDRIGLWIRLWSGVTAANPGAVRLSIAAPNTFAVLDAGAVIIIRVFIADPTVVSAGNTETVSGAVPISIGAAAAFILG